MENWKKYDESESRVSRRGWSFILRRIVVFLPSNIFTRPSLQVSFAQGRSDAQPAIVVFSRYNTLKTRGKPRVTQLLT